MPIRLGYRDPFVYPLSEYLNGINWAFWDSPADTDCLIEELRQAIAGQPLSIDTQVSKDELTNSADPVSSLPFPFPAAQPLSLEPPEGTMDAESQFYVSKLLSEPLTTKVLFEILPSLQKAKSSSCIFPLPIKQESERAFCIEDSLKEGAVGGDRTQLSRLLI